MKSISVSMSSNYDSLLRTILYSCGILSSLLYIAMNIFIPMLWTDYSCTSQTVSELSAIRAPTRQIWISFAIIYTLLMIAFGYGVRKWSADNGPLKIVGGLLITYGVIGIFWPPMHLREELAGGGATLSDTMHIVFTVITILLMFLSIRYGAVSFGKQFRNYSILTFFLLLAFGILTSIEAPNINSNLPTPLIGIWERINIGVFLIWIVTLGVTLLRKSYFIKTTKVE